MNKELKDNIDKLVLEIAEVEKEFECAVFPDYLACDFHRFNLLFGSLYSRLIDLYGENEELYLKIVDHYYTETNVNKLAVHKADMSEVGKYYRLLKRLNKKLSRRCSNINTRIKDRSIDWFNNQQS